MKSENINELSAALVKAQGEFPAVTKDSQNPFFKSKYADLATVVKTAAPILSKHGLAISQFISNIEGSSALTTYLLHESGQFIAEQMPLMLPKQDPQGQGSAITYARRYGYMSVLGLVADEDDDGNQASLQTVKPFVVKPGKLSAEEISKLLSLAKSRGLQDKDQAVKFLNQTLTCDDFTTLDPAYFDEYKKLVITTPLKEVQDGA